jgi:hypothetical protein
MPPKAFFNVCGTTGKISASLKLANRHIQSTICIHTFKVFSKAQGSLLGSKIQPRLKVFAQAQRFDPGSKVMPRLKYSA